MNNKVILVICLIFVLSIPAAHSTSLKMPDEMLGLYDYRQLSPAQKQAIVTYYSELSVTTAPGEDISAYKDLAQAVLNILPSDQAVLPNKKEEEGKKTIARSFELVDRAILKKNDLAEAYLFRGYFKMLNGVSFTEVFKDFDRALALNNQLRSAYLAKISLWDYVPFKDECHFGTQNVGITFVGEEGFSIEFPSPNQIIVHLSQLSSSPLPQPLQDISPTFQTIIIKKCQELETLNRRKYKQVFDNALEISPQDVPILIKYANFCTKTGDYPLAKALYLRAIDNSLKAENSLQANSLKNYLAQFNDFDLGHMVTYSALAENNTLTVTVDMVTNDILALPSTISYALNIFDQGNSRNASLTPHIFYSFLDLVGKSLPAPYTLTTNGTLVLNKDLVFPSGPAVLPKVLLIEIFTPSFNITANYTLANPRTDFRFDFNPPYYRL